MYSDPDTDARAAMTMDRVTLVMVDINNRFTINHTIMGGDFNFCLANGDRNSTSCKPRAEGKFSTIVTTHDLFDIGTLCSTIPSHTYFSHRHEASSERYNRFHFSADLIPGVTYKIMRRTSDHAPIVIDVLKHRTGKTPWEFNDDLLKNTTFIQKLQDNIKTTLSQYTSVPLTGEENIGDIQYYLDYNQLQSSNILTKVVDNTKKMSINEEKKAKRQELTRRKGSNQETY